MDSANRDELIYFKNIFSVPHVAVHCSVLLWQYSTQLTCCTHFVAENLKPPDLHTAIHSLVLFAVCLSALVEEVSVAYI